MTFFFKTFKHLARFVIVLKKSFNIMSIITDSKSNLPMYSFNHFTHFNALRVTLSALIFLHIIHSNILKSILGINQYFSNVIKAPDSRKQHV